MKSMSDEGAKRLSEVRDVLICAVCMVSLLGSVVGFYNSMKPLPMKSADDSRREGSERERERQQRERDQRELQRQN